MKRTTALVILSWLSGPALVPGQTQTPAAAAFPLCVPSAQAAAPGGRGRAAGAAGQRGQAARGAAPDRIPRDAAVTMIPGVVAAGVQWTKVWQAGGNSADGIVADKDGNALVAQEDFDAVLRIDKNDKASVVVSNAKGVGSLSMDRQGRLYGVHRTERPGSTKPDQASIVNAVTILAPERKMVAEKWADGSTLTARPNDLAADGQGGAYFTSGCVYDASADGKVTVVADSIRTNGIVFNPDDKI